RPWLSISTHISTLALGLSTLALPVDCSGDFGPRGLPVQYTQDVRGCPPAHTGRPWLSMCDVRVCPSAHTGRPWLLSVGVRVCPSVSVSTHITSVAVHQYTYQHVGPWTQHAGPSRGLFGTHRTSVGVRQHTQDVRGCLWLSVSTHRTSLAVRVCPCVTPRTSVCVRQQTQDVCGCPCVSLCVRQHTQDVRGLHTGRLWVSARTYRTFVAARGCPCCPCVCVNTHRTTLALPVDCSGDFGPRGLSVQYTQDVRVCRSAHTGRSCVLSVGVRVFPSVSVSTHRTSVAVHQYTYQHVGPWTQHAGPSHGLFGLFWPTTHRTSVAVRQHTGRPWLSVCVRVCPWVSANTHRTTSVCVHVCPCVFVCVRQHTGRPWLSISTHISTLVLRLSTLALPVDCSGDFGPRGLPVQYTQDVRGCPPAHTGRLWLSMFVRVCPSAHTRRMWLSISTHISTLALPVDCSGDFGPRGLSVHTHRTFVCVRQNTQDTVRGCPCVSVCVRQHTQDVRGCPSVHISARRPLDS
ncbi:unnamed protein product, partial [Brassica rapa]